MRCRDGNSYLMGNIMEEGTWESDSLDLMCCLLINLMPEAKEARLREAEV